MRLAGLVGTYTWRPADSAQAAREHHITAGGGRLDLSETAFSPGSRTRVGARVGVGDVRVTVPGGSTVEVHATTRFGDVIIDEELRSGPGVDIVRTLPPELADGPVAEPPTIELTVSAFLGDVEIRRAATRPAAAP